MDRAQLKRNLTQGVGAITSSGAITSGAITSSGDLAASGGFRQQVGPFTAPGAAGVTAASQTNLDLYFSHAGGAAIDFVAPRAGSITGLSGALSTAATTAGDPTTLTISATKNGTEVALTVDFTSAGAEVKGYDTAAKDTLTFAAGDTLGISYTSDANLSNTPKLVACLEIEC